MLQDWRAKVLRVVDGDTLEVLVDRGLKDYSRLILRLDSINAPESRGKKKSEKGILAKDFLLSILSVSDEWSLKVKITKEDPDSFGRWIALIYTYLPYSNEEICINDYIVEKGYAEYKKY